MGESLVTALEAVRAALPDRDDWHAQGMRDGLSLAIDVVKAVDEAQAKYPAEIEQILVRRYGDEPAAEGDWLLSDDQAGDE